MTKKCAFSLFVALFLSFCFYHNVYVRFEKIKDILLHSKQGPLLQFTVPSSPDARILLLEIANSSDQHIEIRVSNDGRDHTILSVKPEDTSIYYFELQGDVTLSSMSSEWRLKRAELRNLFGARKGILNYIVISDQLEDYEAPSLLSSVLLFLLLFPLTLLLGTPGKLHLYIFIPIAVLFSSVLFVPAFSNFQVLFALKTYFLILLLLYFPALKKAYGFARVTARMISLDKGIPVFHASLVILFVAFFFLFQMLYSLREFQGNYSGFLLLSRRFVLNNPLLKDRDDIKQDLIIQKGEGGYDAQFFYIMAFDPFLKTFSHKPRFYRRVVDNPPYRYGRIGFSLLTKVFSLNHSRYYPNTMIVLIVLSHVIGAFFFTRIAIFYGRSVWWGLFYPVIPAFTVALRLGLPESIASACLIAGLYYYLRERFLPSSVLFALAVLTRETTALLALIILVREISHRRFKRATIYSIPLLTYLVWRIYVGWMLFPTFGWSGIFYQSMAFQLPFSGIVELYQAIAHGGYISAMHAAVVVFPLFLISLFFLSLFLLYKTRNYLALALFGYALLAVSLNYRTVLDLIANAERVTFEAFVLLLLIPVVVKIPRSLQYALVAFFSLLFVYGWTIVTFTPVFRAGFLWDVLTG